MTDTTRKWLKAAGIALLSVVAFVTLAVFAAVWLISDDTLKSWLAKGATSVLHREVAIAGDFSVTRSLTPVLRAGKISVANAAWGAQPDMLSVREVEVQVALLSLLRGELAGSLVLSEPVVLWEVDDEGASNWDFGIGSSDADSDGSGGPVPTNLNLRIQDGHADYRNRATGGTFDTVVETLSVSYDPKHEGITIDGRGAHNGIPFEFAGAATTPSDGAASPVDFKATSRGAELQLTGSIDPRHDWTVDLDIDGRVDSPATFSPWFDTTLPELGRLAAGARLTGAVGRYRLDGVDVSLDGPGLGLSITGEAAALSATPDLALDAQVRVSNLSMLSPFSLYLPVLDDLPDAGSVRAAAKLSGSAGRYGLDDIDAELTAEGLRATLAGVVAKLGAAPDIELDAAVQLENISNLRTFSALVPAFERAPSAGPATASGRLTAVDGEYEVRNLVVRLDEKHRQLDVSGSVTGLPDAIESDLSVSAHVSDLSDLSELIPVPLPAIGPVTLAAEVRSYRSTVDVTGIDIRLDQEQITAKAHGAMRNVLGLPDVDLWLSTQLANLSDLSDLSDQLPDLPGIGPVDVSAHVYGRGGNLSILGFDARMDRDEMNVELLGSVQDLLGTPDINLQITAELDRLSDLATLPGMPALEMPELGRLTAAAHLQGIGEDYRVGRLHGELRQDGLEIVVDGTVDDLFRQPKIDVGFKGQMGDLGQLEALGLPLELPREGPVTGSGRFRGFQGKYDLSVARAVIEGHDTPIAMNGTISNLLSEPAYDLKFSTGDEPLADLRAIDMWLPDQLADAGPLAGTVRVTGVGDKFAVEDIDVVVRRGDLELAVTGAVRGFLENPVAQVHLSLDSPRLPPILDLLSLEVPVLDPFDQVGPIHAESDLEVTAENFHFDQIDARLGSSDVAGNVRLGLGGSSRTIDVRINSGKLDLDELFASAEPAAGTVADSTGEPAPAPDPGQRVFSSEPFPVSALSAVDVAVNMQVDTVSYQELAWEEIAIDFELEGGRITLAHSHSRGQGGSVTIEAEFDAVAQPPSLFIDARVDKTGLVDLLGLPEGVIEGADTNGWLNVRGSGDSPHALASGLNAAGRFDIGEMRVLDSALRVISLDILTGIFGTLNPLSSDQDGKSRPGFTPYKCGVVGFVIEDGTLASQRGIAFESERFNVGGRGTIDLKSEVVDIQVRPRAKKGLGISLASMTGGFRIAGTLSEPRLTLSISGLAETAAVGAVGTTVAGATAATAATGGAAIIPFLAIGIAGRMTAGQFSCERTLKRLDELFAKRSEAISP